MQGGASERVRDRWTDRHGYTVKLTDVLAVSVPDQPGGLASVLDSLAEKDIVVEYLYSFVRNAGDHALIIFRVDKLEEAEKVLTAAGVKLLSQDEVTQVKRALANPKVTELLSENWSAAGAKGTATDDKDIRPAGLEAAWLEPETA